MSPALVVAASAVVAGLLGLLVPRAVALLPEPERSEAAPGEDPKPLYVDVAAHRGLVWWAAGASAAAAGVVAWAVGPDPWLVALVPVVPVCVALAVVDWHTRLLPSRLVLPATAYALVVALALWPVTGSADALVRGLIGLLVARSFFWLLWFIHSAGMGFGDVRLAALLGIALGHLGWAELLTGVYAGFLVFGLPGLLLAVVRRDRRLLRTAFPFGPFMLVGALVGVLAGPWLAAYLAWR